MATTEYKNVLRLSSNSEALKEAHRKVISEDDARNIIFAYLDDNEALVRFTSKKNGAAGGGKGGFIRLPFDGNHRLTLGLTLHEIAHVINHNDNKERGHGVTYIKILDGLVRSENEYQFESK